MKKIMLLSLIVCVKMLAFGIEDENAAIVTTDILNIRNNPSLNSKVIGKYKFGDIIKIYKEQGTERLQNEELLDLWYKISPNEDKWINALYVTRFPFVIPSVKKRFYSDDDTKMYEDRFFIDNYEIKNGKTYLIGNVGHSKPVNVEVSDKIVIGDSTFILFDFRFMNLISFIKDFKNQKNAMQVIRNEFTEENIIDADDYITYSTKDFYARCLPWVNDSMVILDLEIFSSKYILKYGIRVGTNINDVFTLLGEPYKTEDNKIFYYNSALGANAYKIVFVIENNIIKRIIFRDQGP